MQTHAEIPASPLSLGLCYGSLCALDADALSPRDALQLVYELVAQARGAC